MFRKIVSNLPFSPALVGQLGFYAKRLRKEEATRRIGLIFTVLALVVQSFAVFTPPESANAANGDNVIYGGIKNKDELLQIYDRNKDSAGHTDIQQIYTAFGITREDIVKGTLTTFNSRDDNLTIQSAGRSNYSWQRDAHVIPNTSTTLYTGALYKFDSTSWTTVHGSMYYAIVGKRAIDGKWFAIMLACGNPTYVTPPPPPPQPSAACSALTIVPITRTKFTFKASSTTANGAKIAGYAYSVKNSSGSLVLNQTIPSTSTESSTTYDFTKDGTYTVDVAVNTTVGQRTGTSCQKSLTVAPEAKCALNSDLVASSPDCKPCEADKTIWYKDKNCHSDFTLTKTVKNISQLITNANDTTAKPGDSLEYHLGVKNVGTTTGAYSIDDNLSDVLEYADLVDTGGGTLVQQGPSIPVENINHITWPAVTLKPGESIEKIVSVQVKSTIPATPQGLGNPESYNCRMVNDFAGNSTTVNVDCPAPKVVEQVITELPHTGASENMLFAGGLMAIVAYFYARSRQLKKEVRLIRRDLNAGTI